MANTSNRELAILEDRPKPVKLARASLLFVTDGGGKWPYKSCTNCHMLWKEAERCGIHGPDIIIAEIERDGKEFYPVCGYWDGGKPMTGKPMFPAKDDPDLTGLLWVQAKGTNCAGVQGGLGCTVHYFDGFCQPLQDEVNKTDCCGAWDNTEPGKTIRWREAQKILKKVASGE